jgi:hypothetical protein
VFCFFDNTDVKLRAPFDAQTLMDKLGIPKRQVPTHLAQPSPGGARQQAATQVSEEASARTRPLRRKASGTAPRAATRKGAADSGAATTATARGTKTARAKASKKRPAGTRVANSRAASARQAVRAVRPRKTAASASRRRAATGSRRSSARS